MEIEKFLSFCIAMKKGVLIGLFLSSIFLFGCRDKQSMLPIDPETRRSENWLSVQQEFNNQIDNSQYFLDLNNFFSIDNVAKVQEKSLNSDIKLKADFDKDSTLQWWIDFSMNKINLWKDENSEIKFNIIANSIEETSDPFYSSWDLSLLYKNWNMYAQVHNFWLFMWEENMNAKMYTLLLDLVHDKWVDLEVNNWWIFSVNDEIDTLQTIKTLQLILETSDIQWNQEFLSNISNFIENVNSYIDLWISSDNLSITSFDEIKYYELSDWIIKKLFAWSFLWSKSAFDISFIASSQGLDLYIYNIKTKDSEDEKFRDTDSDISFSINQKNKSEYKIEFQSLKSKQNVIDLKWTIEYSDKITFYADFSLKPLELIAGQKISWTLHWIFSKNLWDGIISEPSWEILSLSALLSSL